MSGLIKWSVKLGVAGGAVYVACNEKFFGSTRETAEAYDRLKSTLKGNEYVKMLPQAPEMPKELTDGIGAVREYRKGFKNHWNDGVVFVFDSVAYSPKYVSGLFSYVKENLSQMENASKSE